MRFHIKKATNQDKHKHPFNKQKILACNPVYVTERNFTQRGHRHVDNLLHLSQ
jgi:hypothetical protein